MQNLHTAQAEKTRTGLNACMCAMCMQEDTQLGPCPAQHSQHNRGGRQSRADTKKA
jgi:hypothetical protein